jgi:hypothetical protein
MSTVDPRLVHLEDQLKADEERALSFEKTVLKRLDEIKSAESDKVVNRMAVFFLGLTIIAVVVGVVVLRVDASTAGIPDALVVRMRSLRLEPPQ